jgi:hypothetical protein
MGCGISVCRKETISENIILAKMGIDGTLVLDRYDL